MPLSHSALCYLRWITAFGVTPASGAHRKPIAIYDAGVTAEEKSIVKGEIEELNV
jgi:hypothetical protein